MTDSAPDLAARVWAHVSAARLFPEPGTALLAVSGGVDSVALAVLLRDLAPRLRLQLLIGHVDHGIAPDSAHVAAQVAATADRLGFPHHARVLSLGPAASETEARRARYRTLREIQQELEARYLVTAHHADDQIETVLLRALSGSGVAGLAGIPARGPNGLVRPLLPFARRDLEEWLRSVEGATPWTVHQDSANDDLRHDRSWLRSTILPLLRERFGAAVGRRLLRLSRHGARDRRAWSEVVRILPELESRIERGSAEVARIPLGAYHKALSEALLRAIAREAGCVVGPVRAARLVSFVRDGESGSVFELGGGWRAELAFDRLRIVSEAPQPAADPAGWATEGEGSLRWDGWEFQWRTATAGVTERAAFATWVTAGPGLVRAPRAGDRLVPLGGVGRRKVRRLLMESRVPAPERDRYPVVVRGQEVLWVPGVCRAAAAVPRPGEPALLLEVRGPGSDW